jgi:pimeloyl-ACP methyl ester carboxylesterase
MKNIFPVLAALILCFMINSDLSAQSKNLTIEPYSFENSKKEKVEAELGRLKVPENRSKKNGKTIEVAFVRFKSTSPKPGPPIIYLAGGPGGSGVQSGQYKRFDLFMAMRAFGDVIAYEQRGTGMAKPNLRCGTKMAFPLDRPLTREALSAETIEKVRECAESWKSKGVDVSAFNTVESANDLEDLRKALGVKKIRLWGISYGTHLGLATIRQHGKNIESAVLAGVEAMDDTLKLPANTDIVLSELSRRAAIDPKVSKKSPDLLKAIKSQLEELEKKPVTIEVTDPKTKQKVSMVVGKFDVQYIVGAASGDNGAQSMFPKIFHDMAKGDYSFLGGYLYGIRSQRTPSLMTVAMDCASGATDKRKSLIAEQAKTALLGDAINAPFPEVCDAIGSPDLGDGFREPVKSEVPVLFISGTLDGRTPVSNAVDAARGFKNSSHLIIDGAGHSDPLFLSSPKIEETMSSFFKGEELPKTVEIEMAKPFGFVPF